MSRNIVAMLTAAVGVIGANSLALPPIAGAVAGTFPDVIASDVMTATAAYGLGTAISAIGLAHLTDRFGAARCLAISLVGLAIALACSAAAPALAILIGSQALAGLAAGVALPAAYGLAAEIAPPGQQGRVLGRVLTGWTISLVFGVTLSALITDLIHWRMVFGLLAATAGLIALALARIEAPAPRPTGARSSLSALAVPGIARGLFVVAVLMLSFYGPYTYLGPHLTQTLGLSATAAALPVLAYGTGFGLASRLDPLIDRLGYARLAPWVFCAVALVLVTLGTGASSYPLILAAAFGWGMANHLALNLAVGRLTALDPTRRGAVMGLNSAVTYLAAAIAALAFRPIVELWGFAAAGWIAGMIVLMAALEPAITRARGSASRGQGGQSSNNSL